MTLHLVFYCKEVQNPSLSIEFFGETLMLLASGAAFLPEHQLLVVSDLHLGKANAMRARGAAIPSGASRRTLDHLSRDLRQTGATRLWSLGDLFHAQESHRGELHEEIRRWTEEHPGVDFATIYGNHDRRAGIPSECAFRVLAAENAIGIELHHEPPEEVTGPGFAGHLHPAVRVQVTRSDTPKLPCWWCRDQLLVFPAYGEFTGGAVVIPAPSDRVFALAGDRVIEIPAAKCQPQPLFGGRSR